LRLAKHTEFQSIPGKLGDAMVGCRLSNAALGKPWKVRAFILPPAFSLAFHPVRCRLKKAAGQ